MGVIFNEPTRRRLGDFLTGLTPSLAQAPIYEGGPVEKSILTLVGLDHRGNKLVIRSHLTPELARDFLEEHKEGGHIRAYMGYSGWAAGQLEGEIENGDWQLMPFTPALIEPMSRDSLWQWAVKSVAR